MAPRLQGDSKILAHLWSFLINPLSMLSRIRVAKVRHIFLANANCQALAFLSVPQSASAQTCQQNYCS